MCFGTSKKQVNPWQNLGFPKCQNTSRKQLENKCWICGISWKWAEIIGNSLEKPMRNDRCFGTSKKQVNPIQNLDFPKCENTSRKQWENKCQIGEISWKWTEIIGNSLEKPMRNDRCFGTSKKQVNPWQNLSFPKCGNTSQKQWKTNAKWVEFHENDRKSLGIHWENQCGMIGVLGLRKSK